MEVAAHRRGVLSGSGAVQASLAKQEPVDQPVNIAPTSYPTSQHGVKELDE